VVVIDNLLTGHESNLEEVRGSVDFQRADICNYEEIAPLIRGGRPVVSRSRHSECAAVD